MNSQPTAFRPLTIGAGLLGVAVLVTGCRVNFADDFGPTVTESFDIESFTELKVGGAWDVVIDVGPEASLEIEAEEDLFDDIDVDVDGDRLSINLDEPGWFSNTGRHTARLTTPDLSALDLDGAVSVEIDGLDTSVLNAELDGAVKLDLGDMDVEEFDLDMNGAPSVSGRGSIGRLRVDTEGAASVDFDRVEIDEVEVDAHGASSLELSGADSIVGELSGAASINASDSAAVDVRTSGAASVNR